MFNENEIRQLLIDSCHSSMTAEKFFRKHLNDGELIALLVHIAYDTNDHGGDAPMAAAYWLSEASGMLLLPHEPLLFMMLPIVNGYGGSISLALAKTRSVRGQDLIREELGDGQRVDAWLFNKALECYAKPEDL